MNSSTYFEILIVKKLAISADFQQLRIRSPTLAQPASLELFFGLRIEPSKWPKQVPAMNIGKLAQVQWEKAFGG
jgi:hypothetical protein